MAYNYKIAKDVLTDKDKERLVCIHLNRRADNTIDWEKATAEFDCASVSSMQVMTRGTLKKITDAGGKIGDEGQAATPKKKTPGKKRNAATSAGDTNDGEDGESTPAPKKSKGRGKKAAKAAPEVDEEVATKEEPASDDDF